jgi:uncharacterized protein
VDEERRGADGGWPASDIMQGRSRLMTSPGSAPGAPSRLDGQEAIRDYSRHFVALPMRLEEFEVAELHQTQDPEVVIAEMRVRATLTTTGQSFNATSIQVLRIREGQIVLFRDFANPRVLGDLTSEPRQES